MLTKADWRDIWEEFNQWYDDNEQWREEQFLPDAGMLKIQELVNAKLRAKAPIVLPMQVLDPPEPITNKDDSS